MLCSGFLCRNGAALVECGNHGEVVVPRRGIGRHSVERFQALAQVHVHVSSTRQRHHVVQVRGYVRGTADVSNLEADFPLDFEQLLWCRPWQVTLRAVDAAKLK